jgi:hypothetical protein
MDLKVAGLEFVGDVLEKTGSREDVAGRRVDQHHHVTSHRFSMNNPKTLKIACTLMAYQTGHCDGTD